MQQNQKWRKDRRSDVTVFESRRQSTLHATASNTVGISSYIECLSRMASQASHDAETRKAGLYPPHPLCGKCDAQRRYRVCGTGPRKWKYTYNIANFFCRTMSIGNNVKQMTKSASAARLSAPKTRRRSQRLTACFVSQYFLSKCNAGKAVSWYTGCLQWIHSSGGAYQVLICR